MSTTIDIGRGHTASLRDPADMTVGQRRSLQVAISAFGEKRFNDLIRAGLTPEGEAPVTPEETAEVNTRQEVTLAQMNLTETDWDLLLRVTNASVYGVLESWSLPQPIPASPTEVDNIPAWAADAITSASAKAQAEHIVATDTTVDGIENPESPTGASDDSAQSSSPGAISPTFQDPSVPLSTSTAIAASPEA